MRRSVLGCLARACDHARIKIREERERERERERDKRNTQTQREQEKEKSEKLITNTQSTNGWEQNSMVSGPQARVSMPTSCHGVPGSAEAALGGAAGGGGTIPSMAISST